MNTAKEQLEAYALGLLEEEDRAAFERELNESESLRQSLDEVNEAIALAGNAVKPVSPSAALKNRLLRSLDPAERFSGLIQRLMTFLDVDAEEVEQVVELARSDRTDPRWEETGLPGIRKASIKAGPRRGSSEAYLLYLTAGSTFPPHRHVGTEWGLILEGSVIDSVDGEQSVGDIVQKTSGSTHSFRVPTSHSALFVVILQDGGIEFSI